MAPIYPFPMEMMISFKFFEEESSKCEEVNSSEDLPADDRECTESTAAATIPADRLVSQCVDPFESTMKALSNNNNLRLLSRACKDSDQEIFDNPLRPNLETSPVEFDLKDDYQRCVAEKLGSFLDFLKFDEANQKIHPGTYGIEPIYDTSLTRTEVLNRLKKNPELTKAQKLAIGFFMYGDSISADGAKRLFEQHPKLFSQLQELNLIVAHQVDDKVSYRLNDLTMVSHQLPNNKKMYLFAEIPSKFRAFTRNSEPTAQISGTSYRLLHRLQKEFTNGIKYSGVAADFGAGIGIQAIALLMMHPQLQEVISLEIDQTSMNLNRFNAMMNGLSDRIKVVDNMDTKNLRRELNGRKLDLAVSNPPFNVGPKGYEEHLGDFGNGGEQGIDVTKIFFDQAIPELKPGGKFIFYSQLAKNENGDFFSTNYLKDKFSGIEVIHERESNLESNENWDRKTYAFLLARFIQKRQKERAGEILEIESPWITPKVDEKLKKDIETKLKNSGVSSLTPRFVQIIKTEGSEVKIKEQSVHLPSLRKEDSHEAADSTKGGVYIQRQRLGGAYETQHAYRPGGVFLRDEQLFNIEKIKKEFCEKDAKKYPEFCKP